MSTGAVRDLERRLDQAYAHIELLTARLVDVEQRLPMLMFEAGALQGIQARFEKIEQQLTEGLATGEKFMRKVDAELARHDARIQEVFEIWRGTQQRIERQTGTLSDLLQRFEAWKSVGNEMGEEVRAQTNVVQEHGERLGGIDQRLERHAAMHAQAVESLKAIKELLVEFRVAVTGEPLSDEPAEEPKPDPGSWTP